MRDLRFRVSVTGKSSPGRVVCCLSPVVPLELHGPLFSRCLFLTVLAFSRLQRQASKQPTGVKVQIQRHKNMEPRPRSTLGEFSTAVCNNSCPCSWGCCCFVLRVNLNNGSQEKGSSNIGRASEASANFCSWRFKYASTALHQHLKSDN